MNPEGITVELPREEVIALIDNPENLAKGQSGLHSFEPLRGEPGQPGAQVLAGLRGGSPDRDGGDHHPEGPPERVLRHLGDPWGCELGIGI